MDEGKSRAYRENDLGEEVEILLEEEKEMNGICYTVGHTKDYVLAAVEGSEPTNRFVTGRAEAFLTNDILLLKK